MVSKFRRQWRNIVQQYKRKPLYTCSPLVVATMWMICSTMTITWRAVMLTTMMNQIVMIAVTME